MPNPVLTVPTKERARAGDLSALSLLHDFCRAHNVRDSSTLATILDIAFHNLRPELHCAPTTTTPKDFFKWIKAIAISMCIIAESLDSMLANFPFPRPDDVDTLRPLPISSCRQMAVHWENHIWPCLSALTDYYIVDDLQSPITAHIHQETAHTAVSKLFMYLGQDKMGMQTQIQNTEGISLRPTRLLVQYLKWYPHPSGDYIRNIVHMDKCPQSASLQELENSSFIPTFSAYLPLQGTVLRTRNHEFPIILTVAQMAFSDSEKMGKEAAHQHPEILDGLLKAWVAHNAVNPPIYDNATSTAITAFIDRQRLIMQLVATINGIVQHGGWVQQRQALKRHILRIIVQPVSTESGHRHMGTSLRDLIQALLIFIRLLAQSLSQYCILTLVQHEVHVIQTAGMDKALLSSDVADLQELKASWSNFCRVVSTRVVVMKEYNESVLLGAPFCSLKENCPRDMRGRTHKCFVCKIAYYCSRRCQSEHWEVHKLTCRPYKEQFKADEREVDFLEYQLNYDLQHTWRAGIKNPQNIPFIEITYVICDYRVVPPEINVQPHKFEGMFRELHPGNGMVLIIVTVQEVQRTITLPVTWMPKATIVSAVTPGGTVLRKKGERLMTVKVVLNKEMLKILAKMVVTRELESTPTLT